MPPHAGLPVSEIVQRLFELEKGFCLWVGAGVTHWLASGHAPVPGWDHLAGDLEAHAGIESNSGIDLSKRLEMARARLRQENREQEFDQRLRVLYYRELCRAVLRLARVQNQYFQERPRDIEAIEVVPMRVRQLAALGHLANPIVSFNIEHLSSLALGRPCGSINVISYSTKQEALDPKRDLWWSPSSAFRRCVYHPHGLVYHGGTVMTAADYKHKKKSLAAGMPAHSAFGNDVVIVGLSLREPDLVKHLKKYRGDIKRIIWFEDPKGLENNKKMCERLDIKCFPVEWESFWAAVSKLPIEWRDDGRTLRQAWYLMVHEAVVEFEGGELHSLKRVVNPAWRNAKKLVREAERLAKRGAEIGESGVEELVDGDSPRSIELQLSELLKRDEKFRFPFPSFTGG